ncbi:hypothetical protein LWI29_017841 [Acer saccharum]|uniref:Nucleolar pre-ribosomal-associated protein 1 N-terminal domain-containing protein n=1 Tax=Acer saccharum TaxID=4024 RepID=A0AA39T4N3_ACESA|nr:hypothetical protein LWI29_017841 [Acer saccharum]
MTRASSAEKSYRQISHKSQYKASHQPAAAVALRRPHDPAATTACKLSLTMEEPISPSDDRVMLDDEDGSELEVEDTPKLVFKANHEAKLKELLHKINSLEIKLCSDATKEFIKLLKGESGGELLRLYVYSSNKFSELMEAWKVRQGKPGLSYILSLISAIFSHPEGIYKPNKQNEKERIVASRIIDKFVRMILDEKMGDIYKELNSKDGKRQNAALLLIASIVRRGSGLASEVAKSFDFKLQVFSKLADYKQSGVDKKKKHLTRKSFVRFAMSFLEVGKPGLLRWVLQQKEMYFGVLRGLGNDEDETIIYVLSTLRNRVLTEESLVLPGLRSVLFGSVTLEQLVSISGRENGGTAAELAHHVLVMVCTDPCNGLMPNLKRHPNPLRGNPNRLLGLMKKLKTTEISYHRDLLLAILQGRPSLGATYLDEFPYNLEDYASSTWFANVSLAANLVSSVGSGLSFDFLDMYSHDPPSFDNADVQSILNCICPRPFSRSVINKGLLHSDFLVKHGTLRLLLEALKLLDSFTSALHSYSCSSNQMMQSWASLNQEIQNEVRNSLPDPQVLLSLFSLQSSQSIARESHSKRKAESANLLKRSDKGMKKLKMDVVNEDTDIIISGINSSPKVAPPKDSETAVDILAVDQVDTENDFRNVISEIWGLDLCSGSLGALKDADIYFHSKLLDALKIYLRTVPTILEGSFDFFVNLLSDPLALPTNLQSSLLSLLIEYIGCSTRNGISVKTPPQMYKHLQPFINLLIFSPIREIRDQAYSLARAAMLSTGAFDRNPYEIDAWFLFLPGHSRNKLCVEDQGLEVLQSLCRVVISFLCDAVSTVGNSLFKYWAMVEQPTSQLRGFKDISPDFSPLIICVLQKCLRLLSSESGTFSLPEKSIISLYVCNTLKYLLQTQVNVVPLSALMESILSEGLEGHCSVDDVSGDILCEWRPLKNLLLFSQSVSHGETHYMFSNDKKTIPADSSFANTVSEVKKLLSDGQIQFGIIKAFSSAMLCATQDGILENFPPVMTISQKLLGVPVSLLSSVIFHEQGLLTNVSKLWPEMFFSGLEMALSMMHHEVREVDACGIHTHSFLAEEMLTDSDFDATESVARAFSFFLKQAPFHVLFPAIMSVDTPYLSEPSNIKNLLLAKLSEWTSDSLISYLRLVLFWFYQIQSSYRTKPEAKLQQLSEICLILVKHLFAQLLVLKSDSSCPANAGFPLTAEITQEVVETIFCHPAVLASLSCPLSCNEGLTKGNLGQSLEELLSLCRQGVHKIDNNVLDMLKTTFEYLLSGQHSILQVENDKSKSLVKAFDALVQRLLLEIRNKFDLCIGSEDVLPLLPGFYALQALIRFISPFELLELVHWMFSRDNVKQLSARKSGSASALSVGFCIAGGAFEALSSYLQQPIMKRVPYDLLWSTEEKTFDVNLIEEIYIEVCKFVTNLDLNIVDSCLLKAVHAIYCQNHMQHHNLHPLSYVMSRVVVRTPVEMISHCIDKLNMTKAKFMFLLTKMSPVHLSVFGNILLGTVNKDPLFMGKLMGTDSHALSDEDLMMLLPAALSYLDLNYLKFEKQYYKHFTNIPSFYSSILLNGFRHWKSFVSGYMFQEEYDELIPSSTEELLNLVDGSLLGKAVHMLRYHFALSGDSLKTKKLVKLFNSICPCSSTHKELLVCDANEINFNSVNQSLNLINKVVAKISLCRMLLFPEDSQVQSLPKEADGGSKEPSLESGSGGQYSSRMWFMNILVGTWQLMVKILSSVFDGSSGKMNKDSLRLYKFLEVFLLRNILELTKKMLDSLIQLQSIPFLEQLIRSCLLYRFEDSTTLKMLQSILTSLSEGQFSGVLYLQLLLAHSQFAPSIQSVARLSNVGTGVLLRPMSSILRSLVIPHSDPNIIDGKSHPETTQSYMKQLEIIKLLRTVLQFSSHLCDSEFGGDSGINLRELYSLLLSSYGATLSDIDLEIYSLMREIELIDKSDNEIAQFDYLWGGAALKIRKEQVLEQDASSNDMIDTEVVNEHRRRQFRENLPIDPKICAMTVLYFPYDRSVEDGPLSSNKLEPANVKNKYEIDPPNLQNIQRYDPVFILRFSIYSLSVGYIEPVEFAGLGLLAVAFVSMASLDVGMRKLGYEALGRFKDALEMRQRKKEVMRLRLLLTYMQNGIEEPWQRIPSVIAIFAAETSLLLLDPSHDHYTAISKFFMRSSRVNMKCIPLFLDFFSSSSVNFRSERLWILRLAYAGLNLEDDAQIYIRNSILEILLSFYSSPLSDNESKKLILMIVKKSVKLHKMACYLVEHCGLLSWLSSLLPLFTMMLLGDGKRFFLTQLVVVIEVVNDVISSRNITEWLQKHALEQLMELSSRLYKLLVGGVNLIRENVSLVNSILEILISTLKISQKRKMYQPHFTLSLESLLQIYEVVNVCNTANPELGLKAILMSTPAVEIFHMNQEILSSFLTWAVSTALKSDFAQLNQLREPHIHFTMISEDALAEESLTSKLLRWLVASVILGKLSAKLDDSKRSHTTLLSLLENVEKGCQGINKSRFDCGNILAAAVVHLQHNLGMHCRVLPSVVSALSLLIISDVSECVESNSMLGHRTSLPSLLSKIHCPAEANPSWRWSFYQPWKNLSSEPTDLQKMDELHACQTLVVIISNILGKKSSDSRVLSCQDFEISSVFEWERSIIEADNTQPKVSSRLKSKGVI